MYMYRPTDAPTCTLQTSDSLVALLCLFALVALVSFNSALTCLFNLKDEVKDKQTGWAVPGQNATTRMKKSLLPQPK